MTATPTGPAAGNPAAEYDVCVVGLGPTGMTMAHLLARRGVSVLVLEREPTFYGMARAVYTDDECLRILQAAGVADELHADMTVDLPIQWVRADGRVLAQFRSDCRPQGWPVSNFLYQPTVETTLEQRLADHPNVTVRRGREVISFEQDDHGVTVVHADSEGTGYGRHEPQRIAGSEQSTRVAYLVAADGGRSTVRTSLGIEMEGRSFPQRWLVIDLRAHDGIDAFRHLPYFDFVCDPAMPTVSCPQPGGRHRFEFMLADDDRTEDFQTIEAAHRLLARYVDVAEVEIDRQLVYTFNALVARQWRVGRVILAGDAAHMTPQFIGQGMNAGIRDADNLSWKLADVLQHNADSAILDSYQSERRPHAKAMIDLSVFNKDLVSTQSPGRIRARDLGVGAWSRIPVARTFLTEARMKPRPRFRRDAYLGLPRRLHGARGVEGTLMPQPPVRTYAGRPVRLDDALGAGWVVLGVGVDPRDVAPADPWEQLGATWACVFAPGTRPQGTVGEGRGKDGLVDLEAVDAQLPVWLRRAGAGTGSVVVLRPDKYVFSVTGPGQHATAAAAAREQLGVGSR